MDNITLKDLKETSNKWMWYRDIIYPENKIFFISPDIILNYLFHAYMNKKASVYKEHFNSIKNDGWNDDYPITIAIGTYGEVYVRDGSHRINWLMYHNDELKINKIPVKFSYSQHDDIYKHWIYLFNFYKNQLIPDWNKNE